MTTDPSRTCPRKRRHHTKEFKQEAIKLALREDVGFSRAAEELGIHPGMLYKWHQDLQQGAEEAFPGQGRRPALEAELEQARRRIRTLEMERDILKKAAAFFAKESP